nr:MAG TPA: hypothetical protein [Bacteriophage sp.]
MLLFHHMPSLLFFLLSHLRFFLISAYPLGLLFRL